MSHRARSSCYDQISLYKELFLSALWHRCITGGRDIPQQNILYFMRQRASDGFGGNFQNAPICFTAMHFWPFKAITGEKDKYNI